MHFSKGLHFVVLGDNVYDLFIDHLGHAFVIPKLLVATCYWHKHVLTAVGACGLLVLRLCNVLLSSQRSLSLAQGLVINRHVLELFYHCVITDTVSISEDKFREGEDSRWRRLWSWESLVFCFFWPISLWRDVPYNCSHRRCLSFFRVNEFGLWHCLYDFAFGWLKSSDWRLFNCFTSLVIQWLQPPRAVLYLSLDHRRSLYLTTALHQQVIVRFLHLL